MKFCPNCGTPVIAGSKFCAECGQKLAPAVPAQPAPPAPQPAPPAPQPVPAAPQPAPAAPQEPKTQTFTQPKDAFTPPKPQVVKPQAPAPQPAQPVNHPAAEAKPEAPAKPQSPFAPPKAPAPKPSQSAYAPPKAPAPKPAAPVQPKPPVQQPGPDYVPPKPIVQPQDFRQPQGGYTAPKPAAPAVPQPPVQPKPPVQQPGPDYVPPKPIVQPQDFRQPQGGYTAPKPAAPAVPQPPVQPKPPVQQPAQPWAPQAPQPQSTDPQPYGTYTQPQGGYTAPQPQVPPQPYYQGGYEAYPNPAPRQSKASKPAGKKSGALKWILLGGIGLLVIGLIIGLVSCVAGGSAAGSDDPRLGMYEAISCEYEGMTLSVEDEWIELKAGKRATIKINGEEYACRWTTEADGFYLTQGGDTFAGILKDDILTLTISGVRYTYQKVGSSGSATTPTTAPDKGFDFPFLDDQDTETQAPGTEDPTAAPDQEPVGVPISEYYAFENCAVEIVGAELYSYQEEDYLRVFYRYTNLEDAISATYLQLDLAAYQDGEPLEDSPYSSSEVYEYDNEIRVMQPGVTIDCVKEFVVDPNGGDVEFVIADRFVDASLAYTFDLQDLPGRPALLDIPKITDPTWISGWPDRGPCGFDGECEVYIDTAEVVEGYDDYAILRVYYDVTNVSDEPCSFFAVSTECAFQDGVGLNYASALNSVPEDDRIYDDIAPGETIRVACTYELISDSPVEVIAFGLFSDTGVGAVFALN